MKTHLILSLLAAYLLFAERIFVEVSTGGRGLLPVLDFAIVLTAAMVAVTQGPRLVGMFTRRSLASPWFPYVFASVALPGLAVALSEYPARTLLASLAAFKIVSFLVLGYYLVDSTPAIGRLTIRYFLFVGVVQCGFALAQYCYAYKVFWHPWLQLQQEWDRATQMRYDFSYALNARSVGTYINPNNLGFWSVCFVAVSLTLLKGARMRAGVVLGLITLACSQSRGAILSMIAALLVWMVKRDRRASQSRILPVLVIVAVAGLFIGHAVIRFDQSQVMADRLASGFRALTEGGEADGNVIARFDAWKRGLEFYREHLLGTWGEPQFLFGSFIDSDLVRALLQGSPAYLLCLAAPLLAGIFRPARSQLSLLVSLLSAAILVDAVSANPLSYPGTMFLWAAMGASVGLSARRAAQPIVYKSLVPRYPIGYSSPVRVKARSY